MKKLLVCDVEGTIFSARYKIDGMDYASTMWQPLARSLGELGIQREKELHDKWERKEFADYLDWVEATCEMHKELGLKRKCFENLIECAEYNLGVEQFFETLDRDTFIPVFISGGFQELVNRALRELNVHYGFGACEYFFNKEDDLISWYKLTPSDFD
jgi:phosphoserine phosphatase